MSAFDVGKLLLVYFYSRYRRGFLAELPCPAAKERAINEKIAPCERTGYSRGRTTSIRNSIAWLVVVEGAWCLDDEAIGCVF